jgi:hypothetical protein
MVDSLEFGTGREPVLSDPVKVVSTGPLLLRVADFLSSTDLLSALNLE